MTNINNILLYYNYIRFGIMSKIKKILRLTKTNDDFDWQYYTDHYAFELFEIQKSHTLVLSANDYTLHNTELKCNKTIKPLHPNHRLLYETILQLNPHNIIEFGCGGGDHLHNISTLNPSIQLCGIDISYKQINLVHQRHPNLKAKLSTADITTHLHNPPQVDIAFTQAVLMHIKTDASYLNGIINLFNCATKQVILMENWTTHDFMLDIQQLFNDKKIGWESIYFYYRISPEYNRPHIMVISRLPLPYLKLTTYNILLNTNCDEDQRLVDNLQTSLDK